MKKTKIVVSFLATTLMLFVSVAVYAQAPGNPAETSLEELMKKAEENKGKNVIVADVWVGNAMMKASQDKIGSEISFDISNRLETQTGIKYGLQLRKKGEPNNILDQKSYNEILTLGAQEMRNVTVEYEIPYYVTGDVELMVFCVQENGMTLAANKVADLILNGRNDYIEIKDCYLTIDGDSTDTKYKIGQGMDIAKDENISITCTAKNNFKQEVSAIPTFDTHYRHPFGKLLSTKKAKNIVFDAEQEKQIVLSMPKETRPQSYDIQLTLQNDKNKIISSHLYIHYVIQGMSGTIQNLRLNKDNFTAGETALAYFFWTGSNDSFPDSRNGGTKYGKANIELTMTDASGRACADLAKKEISNNSMEQVTVEIPIKNDCTDNPTISAVLKDVNGNTLDNFSAKIGQPAEKAGAKTGKNSVYIFILIAIIPIVLVVVLIFLRKKNKNISSINIFLFLAILSVGIMYSVRAEAATWYVSGANTTTFYTTMNSTYGVNDTITVYGGGYTSCANAHTLQMWGGLAGKGNQYFWNSWDSGLWWTTNATGSATWPGPHPLGWQTSSWGACDYALGGCSYANDSYYIKDVPAVSMGFFDNPIPYGAPARIQVWSAGADNCVIWGGGFNNTPVTPNTLYDFYSPTPLYGPTTFDFICGNSAGGNYSRQTISVMPAPAASISASPNPIAYNAASTVSWSSNVNNNCWVWDDTQTIINGWAGTSGSFSTGALTAARGFHAQCYNSAWVAAPQANVTVSVNAAPAASISASPNPVIYNGAATVSWSSNVDNNCWVWDDTQTIINGWAGTSGSFSTGALTAARGFHAQCYNSVWVPAPQANVTVSVNAAPTATLSASPSSIISGNYSTLTWSSTNATNCWMWDDTQTEVNGWVGTSGSRQTTNLTATRGYHVECYNAANYVSPRADATVSVCTPTYACQTISDGDCTGEICGTPVTKQYICQRTCGGVTATVSKSECTSRGIACPADENLTCPACDDSKWKEVSP